MTFTHGFQSTLPARGATSSTFADLLGSAHFNPRSPHGERRAGESRLRRADSISIHAPRTGSDRSGAGRTAVHLPISIHAPRTGSDIINNSTFETIKISIHAPRTGSDRESPAHGAGLHYFNPRSPHGERPRISCTRCGTTLFQSTLPARGATCATPAPPVCI